MEGSRSAKVFIYNHSNYYSESDGIDVSGGFETNIAVSKKISETYAKPYSDCEIKNNVKLVPTSDSEIFDIFANTPYSYRFADCHAFCFQEIILKKCNCIDYWYFFPNLKNIKIPRLCNWNDNSNDTACIAEDTTDWDAICREKCPYECDMVSLSVSTSFSALFTDSQTLKVNVFFNELSYEYSTESPAISTVALFGGLGGTFGKILFLLDQILNSYQTLLLFFLQGLFLGFSVLSSCEAVYLLVNIVKILLKKESVSSTEKFSEDD
jgi:hypothetical protein